MAQITLTLELTPETAEALRVLAETLNPKSATDTVTPEIPKAEEKPETEPDIPAETIKPRRPKKKEPELPEEKKEPDIPQDSSSEATTPEAPDNDEISDTPKITISDLRAKALALSKSGKREIILELLAKYGVEKLPDVSEENYPSLMEDLRNADGE